MDVVPYYRGDLSQSRFTIARCVGGCGRHTGPGLRLRPDRTCPVDNASHAGWPTGPAGHLGEQRRYAVGAAGGIGGDSHANTVRKVRRAVQGNHPDGPNEATPLAHDGVLFVHSYGDTVQALNATNGDLLWQYSRRLPSGVPPSVKRSISIYGNRLYVPTSDAHIVALDVKTGSVVWDQAVGDPEASVRMTGGILIAKGKVMVGTTGRTEGGNYIAALDAETGEEAWRFYSIARPGEPGGNSWNGLPLEQRNGGSVWIPGSYDPVTNLAFFGPGNTYDTAPLRDLVNQDGVTNDALYLDSTLALNPDTGELVWYFQHQANGQWDLDWAFERQIMELSVNGVMTRVVVTGGK